MMEQLNECMSCCDFIKYEKKKEVELYIFFGARWKQAHKERVGLVRHYENIPSTLSFLDSY